MGGRAAAMQWMAVMREGAVLDRKQRAWRCVCPFVWRMRDPETPPGSVPLQSASITAWGISCFGGSCEKKMDVGVADVEHRATCPEVSCDPVCPGEPVTTEGVARFTV